MVRAGKKKLLFAVITVGVLLALAATVGVTLILHWGNKNKPVVASCEVLGAGGYGAVFNGQIDPFNENYFGATCDMGSIYFSYNQGQSWQRHEIQGTVYCLQYDPTEDGVVWAAGSGVYKSLDHGKTMQMVFPQPDEITSAAHNYENANYWLYTDAKSDYAPHYQIWSIAIDRQDSNHVFVGQRVPSSGMGYHQSIRIYQTTDGKNFRLFREMDYTYNFKLDYDENYDCLVMVTPEKIYEISMDGNIAVTIEQPVTLQHKSGNSLAFDSYYNPETRKTTFAFASPVSEDHVASAAYKTQDLRQPHTYQNLTEQLVTLSTDDFGIELKTQNQGLASYQYCEWINGGKNGGNGHVQQAFSWTIQNVAVLNDDVVYLFHEAETDTFGTDKAGQSFKYITRRTSVYLRYDASQANIKQRFHWVYGFPLRPYDQSIENTTWQDSDMGYCFGMSGSPSNDQALLFSNIVGLYYTADGQTVQQLNSHEEGSETLTFTDAAGQTETKNLTRLTTTGVDVLCTQVVATDPFDENHLLIGNTDTGLTQSYDQGKSWYHALYEWQDGVLCRINYASYTNTCFDLYFDSQRRGVVYALWSEAKSAPYAPGASYLNQQSRFGISYDGGLSWTMRKINPSGTGLAYRMQVVEVGAQRTIYVTMDGYGFYVSKDLGQTFTSMNAGIEPCDLNGQEVIWGLDLVVCEMGTFAITGGSASDRNAGHAFYQWQEDQQSFTAIPLPTVVYKQKTYTPAAVRDLVYDSKNQCLYLACTANVVTNYQQMVTVAGGIWQYRDGQFTQIYDDQVSVAAVNINHAGQLYATQTNGKLVRFNNHNTQAEILLDGLFHVFKNVYFAANDKIIYVTTWGGGTYRITLT